MRRAILPFVAALALVGNGSTKAGDLDFEQARRLTWSRETREAGIAALRRLATGDTRDRIARLELARVLTWNPTTRPEGIALLRRLDTEQPGDAEVVEALSRALSWSFPTRAEAVERLRDLVRREPSRLSAHLLLAEVLSWDEATRRESEDRYRAMVKAHPDSTEARIGLARVLSWRGELVEARRLYREVLEREPGHPVARAGLAEVTRWSGRPRAALRILSTAFEDGTGIEEIRFQRAGAYTDLRRNSAAHREYEAVLAENPDRLAARRGAEEAIEPLKTTLEIGAGGISESGDPQTSQLRSASLPVRLTGSFGGDLRFAARASGASLANDRGTSRRIVAGAGVEGPVGNHLRVQADLNHVDFREADSDFTGRMELRVTPWDWLELRLGIARDILDESRLSAAGEESEGTFYGPVTMTEPFYGLTVRPGGGWDLSVSGGAGSLEGTSVLDNQRRAFFAGLGRSFRAGAASFRLGLSAARLTYDLDLAGFPATDLAGDGVTARGIGGYFSPHRYVNGMVRLDASGPAGRRVRISGGGGLGQQRVEDAVTPAPGDSSLSWDLYLGVDWKASDRVAFRIELAHEDVAAAFDRTRLGTFTVLSF